MVDRKVIDCRDVPSKEGCTLAIEGAEGVVLETALLHAQSAHRHAISPEFREQLRQAMKPRRTHLPEPGRRTLVCHSHAGGSPCDLSLSGREDEVLRAALEHVGRVHQQRESPALRAQLQAHLGREA